MTMSGSSKFSLYTILRGLGLASITFFLYFMVVVEIFSQVELQALISTGRPIRSFLLCRNSQFLYNGP